MTHAAGGDEWMLLMCVKERQVNNRHVLFSSQVRVIPLELQRLFARLLLVDEQTASTTDLTDSFGWTNNEVQNV